MKQILRLLEPQFSNAHRTLSGAARKVLETLIAVAPDQVWDQIRHAAKDRDWQFNHRLSTLVGPPRRATMEGGPLFEIPAERYLGWVRKDPHARARWVGQWLPLAIKDDAGTLNWHPAMLDFVTEFHGAKGALREVALRLRPLTWWGTVGPHLQPGLALLEQLRMQSNLELRRFAEDWIRNFNSEAEADDKREAQNSVLRT